MPRLLTVILILGFVVQPHVSGAKGPKGGGRGGSHLRGSGRNSGSPSLSRPGSRFGSVSMKSHGQPGFGSGQGSSKPFSSDPTYGALKGRNHAFNVQRLNEDRKLAHRQQTAQKLREIAERNGNVNLLQTADMMDQQALDHYDKRMSRIESLAPQGEANSLRDATGTTFEQLTSSEFLVDDLKEVSLLGSDLPGGLSRVDNHRLAQEEWKLQHQLDVAQRLRDNAARNGNESLLRTAERMENMAAERYQRQLDKLGLFSDSVEPVLPPPPVDPLM